MESAPVRGLAPLTDFFDCQAALPFLRARRSVETLTPDCLAACSKVIPCLIRDKPLFTRRGVAVERPRRLRLTHELSRHGIRCILGSRTRCAATTQKQNI